MQMTGADTDDAHHCKNDGVPCTKACQSLQTRLSRTQACTELPSCRRVACAMSRSASFGSRQRRLLCCDGANADLADGSCTPRRSTEADARFKCRTCSCETRPPMSMQRNMPICGKGEQGRSVGGERQRWSSPSWDHFLATLMYCLKPSSQVAGAPRGCVAAATLAFARVYLCTSSITAPHA